MGYLPCDTRIKIGTLKICDDARGQRLGEGAIGLALWYWQKSKLDQIYVTAFPKHDSLIHILKSFGFIFGGTKGGEEVFYKDKKKISYDDPKKSFPYLNPSFRRGGYLPIEDHYHDQMFQFSELKRTHQQEAVMAASDGTTKIYVATPCGQLDYNPGDIIFMYRQHLGDGKTYKSAVTSFCTLVECIPVKVDGVRIKPYSEFRDYVGNKIVLTKEEILKMYEKKNVYALTLIYNGYFGAGNNVAHYKLKEEGLFEGHPYGVKLSADQVIKIMETGGKNEKDIIIDKSRTREQYPERN